MPGVRLLVVEDEQIILLSLVRMLERLGCEVVAQASSGPEAVEQARAAQPEVVLMDVRLAGNTSGVDAARQIRTFSNVPIIFATAHASVLAEDLSQWQSAVYAVAKPFSPSQLKAMIEQVRPRAGQ